jgi:integrase
MADIDLHAAETARNPSVELTEPTRKRRERLATVIEVQKWLREGGTVRHGCGQSLWLQVRGETASWLLRYRYAGQPKSLGLGACDLTGRYGLKLTEARSAADKALALLREGKDPAIAKRERQAEAKATAADCAARPSKVVTFRDVARDFIDQQDAGWRNAKHGQQWSNTLATYAYPVIGDLPPAAVTVDNLLTILRPIWTTKPETASRVRGRIEAVLSAAKVRGLRSGENPAAWKDNLALLLPARGKVQKVRHHPALPWQRMPDLMKRLADTPGEAARCLRFVILTAARSGEVRGLRWREIDLTETTWSVPADRMKAGRLHRVPLSDAALSVLREAAALHSTEPDVIVFPARGGKPLSDMTLTMALRRIGMTDAGGEVITAHGCRSSFRDWVGETGQPVDLAKAALAHIVGDRTVRAYARSDLFARRRTLMDAWAAHCCQAEMSA